MTDSEITTGVDLYDALQTKITQLLTPGSKLTLDGITYTRFSPTPIYPAPQPILVTPSIDTPLEIEGTQLFETKANEAEDTTQIILEYGGLHFITDKPKDGKFQKALYPGVLRIGDYCLVPHELKARLQGNSPENVIGVSNLESYFAYSPEREYSLLFSAAIQSLDLTGAKIIEFGTGGGAKLVEAGVYGATEGLGMELPGVADIHQKFARDLHLNCPANTPQMAILESDVTNIRVTEEQGIERIWHQYINKASQPNTAFINMGHSYDPEEDLDTSPAYQSLEAVLKVGSIDTVVLGGFATEYYSESMHLSKGHYEMCDEMTREILHEFFAEVTVFTWSKKQVLVGKRRIKTWG